MRWLVPNSRTGMVWRIFAAAIIVIGSCAGAVATAGLLQVNTIVHLISVVPGGVKSKQITLPKPGKPQTLLLIGSDHRANDPSFRDANTDTILLVHLNAASSTINVMSIPRDLEVDVPSADVPPEDCSPAPDGECGEKINAAYTQGGYGLLISTIKRNVFPDLRVNHIIDTNFTGFSDLVNAIGCVWTDVDHRYYNVSQPAPSPDNYSSILIRPGYQKLCGNSQVTGALAFVRFRHTDSDFVREARQQDFLRWAKENFPLSKLLSDKNKLLTIFAKHTTLDVNLKTENGILELFDLVINSNGDTLKQIPFPASETDVPTSGPDYVQSAGTAAEASAFRSFMHPTGPTAKAAKRHTTTSQRAKPAVRHGASRHHGGGIDTAGLAADPADGIAQAKALGPGIPVFYPRLILSGAEYCTATNPFCLDGDEPAAAYADSYPRQYTVTTTTGARVPAYFMTVAVSPALGEYYGVQGVRWSAPPILDNPAATKVDDGRRFQLYEDDSGHLTDVAWHVGGDSYWISNTLTSNLTPHEMVAIAESTVRYRG
jgi:LCP family protein required for cell wall assembly